MVTLLTLDQKDREKMSSLSIGSSRTGQVIDKHGAPLGGFAELSRWNDGYSLKVSWLSSQANLPYINWFGIGKSRSAMPRSIYFTDGNGVAILTDNTSLGVSGGSASTNFSMSNGTVFSKNMVANERPFDYASINGLTSVAIGGFGWFSHGDLFSTGMNFDSNDNLSSLSIAEPKVFDLGRHNDISLRIKSYVDWHAHLDGEENSTKLFEVAEICTESDALAGWNEHLKIHRYVQDLFSIGLQKRVPLGGWRAFVSSDVDSFHHRPMWKAADLTPWTSPSEMPPLFDNTFGILDHDSIGMSGVRSWIDLQSRHEHFFEHFLKVHRSEVIDPVSVCLAIGIALDSLGHDLLRVEDGLSKTKTGGVCLQDRIVRICSPYPFISKFLDVDRWAKSMANSYNSHKHKDMGIPAPLNNVLEDSSIALVVLMIWIADKLGSNVNIEDRYRHRLRSYVGRDMPTKAGS